MDETEFLDLPLADRLAVAVEGSSEIAVVRRALQLMAGRNPGDDFLLLVGGHHAQGILDGAPPLYWPEVWGTRALLYVWAESAASAVIAGLGNQAWRVREMSAKVIAERGVEAAAELAEATTDANARVRAAAVRGLVALGADDQRDAITARLRDPDKEVKQAARQALDALRRIQGDS
ncbi:HEAT repeat domain-containing protein [Compostimonas suwonensis]|uniref:HEAT repeat protein n=1 Tax=Compostimonas suwonensis TaxID=1048394 RepID=A0A2M9C4T9_9MICO|nr:HEAT repeat domain-containing protein [Compostimonas suwonensis]PJJ65543.1 HEAT repeat protein [Compostimonas suwonensis]